MLWRFWLYLKFCMYMSSALLERPFEVLHFPSSFRLHSRSMDFTCKLFILFLLLVRPGTAQGVFINLIPAYKGLPPCAEVPLSTIVRDMNLGCGDGGKTTSWSCFCSASSSQFAAKISSRVQASCTADLPAVTAALGVFSTYCANSTGKSHSEDQFSRLGDCGLTNSSCCTCSRHCQRLVYPISWHHIDNEHKCDVAVPYCSDFDIS